MDNKNKVKLVRFGPLSIRKNVDNDEMALQWSVRMGFPRITVYTTNKATEKGKMDFSKVIIAPFDYINLKLFLSYFKDIVVSDDEKSYSVECFNVTFKDGIKTNETRLQAKVVVGKDKDGVIYLAAIEEGKPKIKFELLPNTKWFRYYDKDNNEITDKRVLSKKYAEAYLCLLETTLNKEFNLDVKAEVMLDPPNSRPKAETKPAEVSVPELGDDLAGLL